MNKLYLKFLTASQNGDLESIERLINEEKMPLLFACSAGNKKLVEFMIQHGADVSYVNDNGRNALTVAYKKKHKPICDILISNGANFNCKDGFKLLMENCEQEDMGDFEFLLNNGAPHDGNDPCGMCPLMMASKNGFVEKVRLILQNSLECLNRKNKNGQSSLHFACIYHHIEVARLLIEKGADVNSENKIEETPFMLACEMNYKPAVELLINKGADVNRRNKYGETALIICFKMSYHISRAKGLEHHGWMEMTQFLIENEVDLNLVDNDGNSPLIIAIRNRTECEKKVDLLVQIIKMMIEKKADINWQNKKGETALMVACSKPREWCNQIINFMFERNVNANLQNSVGNTALTIAFESRRFDKARLLIEHGVDLNVANREGNTALMVAVKNFCDLSLVKMMVEKGADVNIQNRDGDTALMVLLKGNSSLKGATSKFLIESEADLKLVNKDKQNALFLAIHKNQKRVFDLIMEKNIINLNEQDRKGNTLLHYACLYGNREEYVELLINKGADLNIQNNERKTPLKCRLNKEPTM